MALAAGIRDSNATVEMIKTFVTVDQVVNRMACRMYVGFGREKSGLGEKQANGGD
jgi:hypothetical protein